jgi:hypothetical protein
MTHTNNIAYQSTSFLFGEGSVSSIGCTLVQFGVKTIYRIVFFVDTISIRFQLIFDRICLFPYTHITRTRFRLWLFRSCSRFWRWIAGAQTGEVFRPFSSLHVWGLPLTTVNASLACNRESCPNWCSHMFWQATKSDTRHLTCLMPHRIHSDQQWGDGKTLTANWCCMFGEFWYAKADNFSNGNL